MAPTTRTPWPDGSMVVTDAGLETWLVFQRGIDLPAFAAYPLVASAEGRAALLEYYRAFLSIALEAGAAIDLETPTWRANPEWAAELGHNVVALGELIDRSVDLVTGVREEWDGPHPALVGGTVGPRGDGYVVGHVQSADEAAAYHSFQVDRLAAAGVDVVTAMTIGYVEEAIGVVRAAQAADIPVVISFTLEVDGTLPSGTALGDAISLVDAATGGGPLHYMLNCAHPTHFEHVLDGAWVERIGGVRANASTLSHAELDVMEELDRGDVADLATRYRSLRVALPALQVIGGCCGTDHTHVSAMVAALR